MDFSYLFILIGVLAISPFVLVFAVRQEKEFKEKIRKLCLGLLGIQFALGFLNWEKFEGVGRNAFLLATRYPNSFLWVYLMITVLEILLLVINKKHFGTYAAILNFANSIAIFAGMIRLINILGYQAVSFASIMAVFLVLILNVTLLMFINKDKYLLKKYPF